MPAGRKTMPLREARAVAKPVVYGLCRPGGSIVYVGMTRNLSRRVRNYLSPKSCHNPKLREWLQIGDCSVTILHEGNDGLLGAEKHHIAIRRKSLFNLVGGGDQNWRDHESKPWMGRTGRACPSAMLLRYLGAAQVGDYREIRDKVRRARDQMSDCRRANYEASLAIQYFDHPGFGPQMREWFDLTRGKMMPPLIEYHRQHA